MITELSKEFPELIFLIIQTLCISSSQGSFILPPDSQAINDPIGKYFPVSSTIRYPIEKNYWCEFAQNEPQGKIPSRPNTTTTTTSNYGALTGTASGYSGPITSTTTTLS